jgi:NADH-quinone oxidoreductase subunit A
VYFEFANVLVFTIFAAAFVVVNLLVARLLRPKSTHEAGKTAIYECGEPTIGPAWIRFDIRFYTVALMFVVFDVEIALLFPWGVVFRALVAEGQGVLALVEAGTFIAILMVGLAYVWSRGDIDWTPTPEAEISDVGSDFDLRSAVTLPEGMGAEPVGVGAGDGTGAADAPTGAIRG